MLPFMLSVVVDCYSTTGPHTSSLACYYRLCLSVRSAATFSLSPYALLSIEYFLTSHTMLYVAYHLKLCVLLLVNAIHIYVNPRSEVSSQATYIFAWQRMLTYLSNHRSGCSCSLVLGRSVCGSLTCHYVASLVLYC
jgi:hypothetical protein